MTPEDPGPRAADVLVLFGITGDLARKLVLPALYELVAGGELTVPVIGVALTDLDTDGLRHHVEDCVRAMGGFIVVESEEARGTTFTLRLPAHAANG